MANKMPDALAKRQFLNVYICMKCNGRVRASVDKIKKGKIKCRKCQSKQLRLKAKERRGQKA